MSERKALPGVASRRPSSASAKSTQSQQQHPSPSASASRSLLPASSPSDVAALSTRQSPRAQTSKAKRQAAAALSSALQLQSPPHAAARLEKLLAASSPRSARALALSPAGRSRVLPHYSATLDPQSAAASPSPAAIASSSPPPASQSPSTSLTLTLPSQSRPRCSSCSAAILQQDKSVIIRDRGSGAAFHYHASHLLCSVCRAPLSQSTLKRKAATLYCPQHYPYPSCGECGQLITGASVEALSRHFHPEHFHCAVCPARIVDPHFSHHEGRAYCATHYAQLSKQCQLCLQPVLVSEMRLTAGKEAYHAACLRCCLCGGSKGTMLRSRGRLYCERDGSALLYHRCSQCGLYADKPVVAGREGEEFYHLSCLKCSVCHSALDAYHCQLGQLRCGKHAGMKAEPTDCDGCGRKVDDEHDVVKSCGRILHRRCFRCSQCRQPLDSNTAQLRDDRLCCLSCFLGSHTQALLDVTNQQQQQQAADTSRLVAAIHARSQPRLPSPPAPSAEPAANEAIQQKSRPQASASESLTSAPPPAVLPLPSSPPLPLHRPPSLPPVSRAVSPCLSAAAAAAAVRPPSPPSRPTTPTEVKLGDVIGSGSFGDVHLALDLRTGGHLAVKVLRPEHAAEALDSARGEIALLKSLQHPNIVAFRGSRVLSGQLHIYMEYVEGKSIDHQLRLWGPFHERLIRLYTRQLLSALAYCHERRVTHRDLKGKNVLLSTSGQVKLADFGSAKRFLPDHTRENPTRSYNFTPQWTAPEVMQDGGYGAKVDIWALGCVMIEMASGKPPWHDRFMQAAGGAEQQQPQQPQQQPANPWRLLYTIGNTDEIPSIPSSLSAAAQRFIRLLLTKDPSKRPTARELLQHPWIRADDDQQQPPPAGPSSHARSASAREELSAHTGASQSHCGSHCQSPSLQRQHDEKDEVGTADSGDRQGARGAESR